MSVLAELLIERNYANASGSPAEAQFLRLLRTARLPLPEREVSIHDDRGRFIGRVDFAYRAERIVIEINGYAYHAGREPWERDHERLARFAAAGWLPLPFTVRAMNQRPDEVVDSVRRALRRRRSGGRYPQ
jgi:very-short-patch-repair endonuclease